MWQSYWKLARRNFVRNGAYTVINVMGMGMALAMCIAAYVTYSYSAQYDAFHASGQTIYRINSIRHVNGEEQRWGLTPLPLAEVLRQDAPGAVAVARLRYERAVVRTEDRVFSERVAFAEPAFLDMFTFPVAQGDPGVLRHSDQVLLGHDMAVKYFGDEEAVGQTLTLRLGDGMDRSFTVGAVAATYPRNSSIQFDVLVPYEVYLSAHRLAPDDWKDANQLTFVQIPDASQVPAIERLLQAYVGVQNAARPDFAFTRFYAEPLHRLAPHSRSTYSHSLFSSVPTSAVVGSCVSALLVLLMACSNFVNLSVVAAGRRMKEIGMRKVMGGRRRELVAQFMGENLLLCLAAMVVALALAQILVPLYDSLWPFMWLELRYRDNVALLGFLGLLLLATGLLAGAYPAYHASAFNPIRIMRGTQQLSGSSPLSRGLLGFQFSVTILGVAGSLLFAQNARYQETLDLGYAREGLLVVPLNQPATFAPLRDVVARHPAVRHVAGTRHHVGAWRSGATLHDADAERAVALYDIGERYLETAGMKVVKGRGFVPEREADRTSSVLVNETLVRSLGWTDPVGRSVTMDSLRYTVVGVVGDFNTAGVWAPIEPTVLRLAAPETYNGLLIQVPPGRLTEVEAYVREAWKTAAPDAPYGGYLQNEVLAEGIGVSQSIRKMFGFIAFITLLIAGTGLFALVSLGVARRTKEIGIRKVLGATAFHIGGLVNREFVLLVGIAAVVAGAGGYFTMEALLDAIYTYHIDVGVWPFLAATLMILALAVLVVSGRVFRAATANPVEALRSE